MDTAGAADVRGCGVLYILTIVIIVLDEDVEL